MNWIQTLDNRQFFLQSPSAKDIDPRTIGVVLSRTCRFGGHTESFYSTAQHSVLVSEICDSDQLRLAALLHDAHEVYSGFGDVLRPAKGLLDEKMAGWLERHHRRIDRAIAKRFGFPAWYFYENEVKRADGVALASESRDVMGPHPVPWELGFDPVTSRVEPWSIDESFRRFMDRLRELRVE